MFVIVMIGVIAIIAIWQIGEDRRPGHKVLTQTVIGGPFSLVDHNDRPVNEKSWPGKILAIYFGYTYCPDVCPLHLASLATALKKLEKTNPDLAVRIQPILISVDPKRDKPDALKIYVQNFDMNLIGLTGSATQIKGAKNSFRVFSAIDRDKEGNPIGGHDGYTISHTTAIYLLNEQGDYVNFISGNSKPEEMVKRILNSFD